MGKIVSMQYQDGSIHSINVNRFCKTYDNRYFIEYFDSNLHIDMYTVLSLVDGILMQNPNLKISHENLASNCKELNIDVLPDYIKCYTSYLQELMPKPPKQNQTNQENQKQVIYVHRIMTYYFNMNTNTYYLDRKGYETSKENNIEIEGNPIIIENRNCYSITKEELDKLIENTNGKYRWMKKNVITKEIKPNKLLDVSICRINDAMYIPLDVYIKYKERETRKIIKVDGVLYINIDENDLVEIKKAYLNDNININLVKKEVVPKNKELNDMLKKEEKEKNDLNNQK